MSFLRDKCTFKVLNEEVINNCQHFSCNNSDLDDFFKHDCINYAKHLLGKSYCFTLDESPDIIVAAFTVSNDSIKTDEMGRSKKKRVTRNIPHLKRHIKNYPAVLIGRLGINCQFHGQKIGAELMLFIKSWFRIENKTGCRYLVVDSYNTKIPLSYYTSSGFIFLFDDEKSEKVAHKIGENLTLDTRTMYFDLY